MNGVIATTTPTGWWMVNPSLSRPVPRLASSGNASPYSWVPSNAASRIRSPERDASPRASVIVLPASALMTCAVCAARPSASSAARSRIRIRSWAGVRRQVTAPPAARSSAARTSAVSATGTVPVTVPSNGEVTSSVRPLAVGCHAPPISISMCLYQPVSVSGRPSALAVQ